MKTEGRRTQFTQANLNPHKQGSRSRRRSIRLVVENPRCIRIWRLCYFLSFTPTPTCSSQSARAWGSRIRNFTASSIHLSIHPQSTSDNVQHGRHSRKRSSPRPNRPEALADPLCMFLPQSSVRWHCELRISRHSRLVSR